MKKGRKYTIEFVALEKDVNWSLAEHQLFRLAKYVEEVCGIPVTMKMKNYNTSASEQIIKRGVEYKKWNKLQTISKGGGFETISEEK